MSLFDQEERDDILKFIEQQKPNLSHNAVVFDIYEGDLMTYVLADLKKQLSAKSFEQIKHRVTPVNILQKLIDKLSKIYAKSPTRTIKTITGADAKQKDVELFEQYQELMDIDTNMNFGNEFFNMFKNTLLMPFANLGKPNLRIVPSERFIVMSTDKADPNRMTHLILFMGEIEKVIDGVNKKSELVHIWTDDEFIIMDLDGDIHADLMEQDFDNVDGLNPYLKIPAIYINRSRSRIMPTPDSDLVAMTKIFPILMSDLNFSVMYQAFSIIFGIDVDDENLNMSPNAFWRFKSNPGAGKPEVGVIKPQVDITQVWDYIMGMFSFWLQSKNIRPGNTGSASGIDNLSALSKMVDEMDTSEDRQKQTGYFAPAETKLFDLIMNHMHPVWIANREIDLKGDFSPNLVSKTVFHEQVATTKRGEIISNVKEEMSLGLLDEKRAAKRLNPEMKDEEIDEMLASAKADKVVDLSNPTIDPGKENAV